MASSTSSPKNIRTPATKLLALLGFVLVAPLLFHVPANINIVITASLCVLAGCWRSVKPLPPAESMSKRDAMTFPLIGSAVLLGLFLLFKFLPKELVNSVLTGYFVLLGTFATTVTILPFVDPLFSEASQKRELFAKKITIPFVLKEPLDLTTTVPELAAGVLSSAFCIWYCLQKHWLANNVLGMAFSVQGIEQLSLGSVQTGVILLSGLFFYDIFWVFCTPVMVSVAKSFDAPIKLLFPRAVDAETGASPFSMLGLGDIVIPGVFVALLLRYDSLKDFRSKYFCSAYLGYVLGLVTTIVVMNVFQAAQPALLYIVPAVLGAVGGHAAYNGEFKEVFNFSEAKAEKEAVESQEEESANGVPASSDSKKTS